VIRALTLLALSLVGVAGACTEPNPYLNICGNGIVEPDVGEVCDDGQDNGEGSCSDECTLNGCGDALVQAPEECDLGESNADDGACTTVCKQAVCGDGLVHEGVEECDAGPMNRPEPDGKGGCSSKCELLAECGDGVVDPDEEDCDDGNTEDDDACPSTCRYPHCGDALIDPGEGCDDGNTDDDDACPSTCQPASCGDGFVYADVEECDDGNDDNSDACLKACIAATCGDGVIQEGVEECDDGNDVPDDGCSDICVRDRLVFITDEPLAPGGFKSLFGADNYCRKTAMDYGYTNFEDFKAWLSDDDESPADRFFHSQGRYVMVTGETVAESWGDLIDGELATGIDRTLSGELVDGVAVWTATRTDGEGWGDGQTCENWSSTDPEDSAHQGISGYADSLWTDGGFQTICAGGGRLYCFEQ